MDLLPLSLTEDIRPALIRQEETIIFALIERSQFPINSLCYKEGPESILSEQRNISTENKDTSMLDYFLSESEIFQAKLGRYLSPEEEPFFEELTNNITNLPANSLRSKQRIIPNSININSQIKYVYLKEIIPRMCSNTIDEENCGSSCLCDIAALQAISKRIHYGKFVAESKFQSETDKFTQLIQQNDVEGLMEALTHEVVEKKVISRVKQKASHYGVDGVNVTVYKVDPDLIGELYEKYLIPLNKDVQIRYLLQRLDRDTYSCFKTKLKFFNKSLEVGKLYFKYETISEDVQFDTVTQVFLSVLNGKVSYGVVPIENISTGLNKETQKCLLESKLKIVDCVKTDKERYFIIGKSYRSITADINRIVVMFSTLHQPGSLLFALKTLEGFNLLCLESTPTINGKYFFYCEIDTTGKELKQTLNALTELEKCTYHLLPVGCYYLD